MPEPGAIDREIRRDPAGSGDVAELRQRLAFYEGFDRIIQENIARSGDLLRLVAERQAQADHTVATARRDVERLADRHRAMLLDLLAAVEDLRDEIGAVTARVAAALEATDERDVPPANGDRASSSPRERTQDPTAAATESFDPALRRPESAVRSETSGNDANLPEAAVGESPERVPATVDDGADRPPDAVPVRQAVVVHGLSDVVQARSLVDHLRGRVAIDTVEPREFVGGVLRLAVAGQRQVGRDDLATWAHGDLEIAEEGRDTLVLRLPGVPTL